MSKSTIIMTVIFFIFLVVALIVKSDGLLLLSIMALIIFIYIFLYLLYIFQRKTNVIRKFEESYNLEVLDNIGKDIYVIKKYYDSFRYIFSYINKKGKKVIHIEKNVEIKETNKIPYVEIYTNIYSTNKILDFLFYSKDYEEKNKLFYVIYINKDMIK